LPNRGTRLSGRHTQVLKGAFERRHRVHLPGVLRERALVRLQTGPVQMGPEVRVADPEFDVLALVDLRLKVIDAESTHRERFESAIRGGAD